MEEMKIKKVWVDSTHVYAETTDGIRASYAFADWPRLANATDEQRRGFHLSCFGIHWPQIDEDLSFEGMFRDNNLCNNPQTQL
ncbi:MAG: DUF2442 domain-containing protein [Prevotella sp.]|jgi:hypothetical protein|nr:DUF2442 domain-containing protein [Prevotella sp.]